MVNFASVAVVLAASLSSASAFTKTCFYPYDVCGYTLANGEYGYTVRELADAWNAIGVPDSRLNGTVLYDSLYSCDTEAGAISALVWCGGAGTCQPNQNGPNQSCAGAGIPIPPSKRSEFHA